MNIADHLLFFDENKFVKTKSQGVSFAVFENLDSVFSSRVVQRETEISIFYS